MSVPVWCAELAAGFWAAVGGRDRFPRDLREAGFGFPLSVVDLPRLRVTAVCHWLAARGVPAPAGEPDRPLRGCLFAHRGLGFAFLDAGDSPAERRFTLAHEIGHFLRDYWQPRERAAARLGAAVRDVLDGLRPATPDERLHAILRRAVAGPFSHLLRRDESGRPLTPAERESEAAADRLAFELLAPAGVLEATTNRAELARRLIDEFGLPAGAAGLYAEVLRPPPPKPTALVARIRDRR